MYVGLVRLTLALPQSHSLKEKRMVVRRVKDRVRERVGAIANEVGDAATRDSWQRAELGCAVVSVDRGKALELVDQVVRVVMEAADGQVIGVAKDVMTFAPDLEPVSTADLERTGAGDKAAAAEGPDADWIPDEWKQD